MRHAIVFAALGLSFALPAEASTLPRVDFRSEQTLLAIGLPGDLSLDRTFSDRLSLGVTTFIAGSAGPTGPMAIGVRGTYRLGEAAKGLTYGLTVSGGVYPPHFFNPSSPDLISKTPEYWVQPALVASLPLSDVLVLRGTVGPLLFTMSHHAGIPAWLWPNLELAARIAPGQELTLGGNSLVGWRGPF
ncbi:hypothetical protein D3C86_1041970 [compost metagenome]